MRRYRNDSGRSIVEMLGVLAIMGVITFMGISGYSMAVGRVNRNRMNEDITRYAQEVRTLYAGQNMYDRNVQTNVMGVLGIKGQVIPNVFGGEYIISVTGSGNSSPFFKITSTKITQSDCVYFATMLWTDARDRDGKDNGGKAIVGDGNSSSSVCQAGSDNKITLVYQ